MHRTVFCIALVMACVGTSAGELPEGSITTESSGSIVVAMPQPPGLYAQVEGSPTLTRRLREALAARGLPLADSEGDAAALLRVKGELLLMDGPHYARPLKLDVGTVTERALARELEQGTVARGVSREEAVGTALDAAIAVEALTAPLGNIARGLALQSLLLDIADLTGVRSSVNKALTGDARGICLSRCEDWKKTHQRVQMYVSYKPRDGKAMQVRVQAKAFHETLAPEAVIEEALGQALRSVHLREGETR